MNTRRNFNEIQTAKAYHVKSRELLRILKVCFAQVVSAAPVALAAFARVLGFEGLLRVVVSNSVQEIHLLPHIA